MSTAQSETFSPQNIGLLCTLLLIAVFLGEVVFPKHGNNDSMATSVDTVEAITKRIAPVVMLAEMHKNPMSAPVKDMADMTPDELYAGACVACHSTGAAGAPKLGDAGEWKARNSKGLDSLISSAINGVGAMPPRGGSKYNDDQMKAVIEYILSESK